MDGEQRREGIYVHVCTCACVRDRATPRGEGRREGEEGGREEGTPHGGNRSSGIDVEER